MFSTEFNMQATGFQSPPGPPSRRLPAVTSGERHYDEFSCFNLKTRAGSTLTTPVFGPNNGVHRRQKNFHRFDMVISHCLEQRSRTHFVFRVDIRPLC